MWLCIINIHLFYIFIDYDFFIYLLKSYKINLYTIINLLYAKNVSKELLLKKTLEFVNYSIICYSYLIIDFGIKKGLLFINILSTFIDGIHD